LKVFLRFSEFNTDFRILKFKNDGYNKMNKLKKNNLLIITKLGFWKIFEIAKFVARKCQM